MLRFGATLRRPTAYGWWVRDNPYGTGSTRESADPTVTWTWHWGPWRPTNKSSMGWIREVWRTPSSPNFPGWGQDLLAIVTVGGMQHHLTSGRMTSAGVDPQLNLGTLRAPPHVVHVSDPRVWDPPPTALPQMWHVRPMEGSQWKTPGHGDVLQEGVSEVEATAGVRGA